MDESVIFSQCVYDADNWFVDLSIRPRPDDNAFILKLTDTSNDKVSDSEINLCLTRVDLRTVITRLTNILNKRE